MPNAEKLDKVAALKERIGGSNALLLAEYRGLTVHDATELRRSLSDQARFAVVKNTLMQRAAAEAGIEDLDVLLAGPTAVAFVEGDVVTAAKRVVDAAKQFPALVLKGAYLDGRVLSAADAQALATLESREVMLSKVAGLLKMEMSRAASMFQALQSRFLGVLEAYKEKVPSGETEAEAPLEAEAPAEGAAEDTADASAETEASAEAEPAAVADVDAGQPAAESAEAPEAETPDESSEADATDATSDDETTNEAAASGETTEEE
jgi:large subunit ribosomal protein L10